MSAHFQRTKQNARAVIDRGRDISNERFMRKHLQTLAVFYGCVLLLGLNGCERGTNKTVQAEPETNNAQPAPTAESTNKPGTTPNSGNLIEGSDKDFIMQAEKDNLQERILGRLAQDKSQNEAIKNYGEMLAQDHSAALRKLVDLMEKYGIAQPKGLPEERKEALQELNGASGAAFDRKFIDLMIRGHEKAVADFQNRSTTVKNSDLRTYIEDQIAVLTKHLNEAKEIRSRLESNAGRKS